MASETGKAQRKPSKGRAADGFVMMAMAIVTLALGMGLVTQVGLSFWLSVTVSAAFYIGLLTLHTLARRHDQLDSLKAEVERLSGEVARLSQPGAAQMRPAAMVGPGPGPAKPAAMPSAPAAGPNAPMMPPLSDDAGPYSRVPWTRLPMSDGPLPDAKAPAAAAAAPFARGGEFAGPPVTDKGPMPQPPQAPSKDPLAGLERAAASHVQLPPVVRAPTNPIAPAIGQKDTGDGDARPDAASSRPPAPSLGSSIANAVGFNRIRRSMAEEAPKKDDKEARPSPQAVNKPADEPPLFKEPREALPPVPAAAGTVGPTGESKDAGKDSGRGPAETVAARPFGHDLSDLFDLKDADTAPAAAIATDSNTEERPGVIADTAKVDLGDALGGDKPGDSVPAMSGAGEMDAGSAWAYRPGDEARLPTLSPRESDVEMIQGLIKKLADEVNSADADKLALRSSREMLDEDALDRSVGALRQAARNMKDNEPAAPHRNRRGRDDASSAAMPGQTGKAGAPAMRRMVEPKSQPGFETGLGPTQRPSTSSSAPPQSVGEPEFDVEALMRRAQPIATMTSMPPQLPAAPNVLASKRDEVTAHPGRHEDKRAEAAAKSGDVRGRAASMLGEDLWDAGISNSEALSADSGEPLLDRLERISSALEAGRVDVYLEPVLDIEKQRARHYEVSVRLRDERGKDIVLEDGADSERVTRALPLLDSLRLKHTAEVARRLEERNKQGNVFSTFSGEALTSDEFLTVFADTYDDQVQLAGQLVLTFAQSDARIFRTPHWTMITEMRNLGFGFALRAVTDLDMDFELLAQAGFKFVKLDADVFLAGLPAAGGVVPAADLCKHLSGLGLTPVVEAIDDEEKRQLIYKHGVRLGQGQLFGGARQLKSVGGSGERDAAA